MIRLEHLSTGYGSKVVARDINATLQRGQLVCLLGPNGAGKSTLLRTLCGFQPALDGEVIIAETPLSKLLNSELSHLVSVVLTERIQVQGMTVRDLVSMGRSPYSGFFGRLDKTDNERVDEALQQIGITDLQNRQVNTLSDGERQKAMIAKALAQHTPIILLDEPTAFLDFPSKVEMMRLLSHLAHQMDKTILLSTHDVELALQQADLLWLMNAEGIQIGTPADLSRNGQIEKFFATDGITYDAETRTFRT